MIRPFQRDEPANPDELRAQVARDAETLRSLTAPADVHRRARLLGRMGAALRVLGRLDDQSSA
jgi:hypothetical protein